MYGTAVCTELHPGGLVLIPAQQPAGIFAVLRKERDRAGNVARADVVVFLLIAFQRNDEGLVYVDMILRRSSHLVDCHITEVENDERCKQCYNDASSPSPNELFHLVRRVNAAIGSCARRKLPVEKHR
jgi:hypothetical protein